METELERHGDCLVLRVRGDLRVWGRPEQEDVVLKRLRSGLDNLPAQLVLSLSGVTHIDTSGIKALVPVLVACARRKIELRVVMPSGVPGEALRHVRVFDPWPSFPDEAAALQAAAAPSE